MDDKTDNSLLWVLGTVMVFLFLLGFFESFLYIAALWAVAFGG